MMNMCILEGLVTDWENGNRKDVMKALTDMPTVHGMMYAAYMAVYLHNDKHSQTLFLGRLENDAADEHDKMVNDAAVSQKTQEEIDAEIA